MSSNPIRANDAENDENQVSHHRYNTRSHTRLSRSPEGETSTLRRLSNDSIRSIYRRLSTGSGENSEGDEEETFETCRSKLTIPGRERSEENRSFLSESRSRLGRLRSGSTLLELSNSGGNRKILTGACRASMDSEECSGNHEKKNKCFYVTILMALAAFIIICVPFMKIMSTMRSEIMDIHQSLSMIKNKLGYSDPKPTSTGSGKLSDEVTNYVKAALQNYDSDKTGKTDYALESIGGKIVKIIDTQNYMGDVGFFGITLCEGRNGPTALIRASTDPGECWAFKGSKGTVQIKLLGKVNINSISLEHISSNLSPTGKLDTAPKEFEIYGMETLSRPKVLLGKFVYNIDGDPIQNFPIKEKCRDSYEYVEFRVHSNHGSKDYTCVYRLRVHGTLKDFRGN